MFDSVIVGAGPAGLSAALNLKLHKKNFVWFGFKEMSKKVNLSEMIMNYPGLPAINGAKLNELFYRQAEDMGITLTGQMVTNITAAGEGYMILAGNDVYETKTVILTTGVVSAREFEGEKEFLGRGVSYCATCDGFFYKGRNIVVYCADKRYEHEVKYLAEMAAHVTVITPYGGCGVREDNVSCKSSPVAQIYGDDRVLGVLLRDGTDVPADGVFVLRDAVSPSSLLKDLTLDGAHIVVDRAQRTNKEGCFAAGDCTGRPYQIAKAVGEGNVAAHSVVDFLSAASCAK